MRSFNPDLNDYHKPLIDYSVTNLRTVQINTMINPLSQPVSNNLIDKMNNTDKQYDLYFSQIIYRDFYYLDHIRNVCELHGDFLQDDEIIEVKWKNGTIEKFKIKVKVEVTGLKSKKDIPYGIITYNGNETLICLENLTARRLFEPKK